MDVFISDVDRDEYLQHLAEKRERFGVEFLAWCLMTNHVLLVVVPRNTEALAKGIGETHKRYSRMVNFREGLLGTSCEQQLASNSN